MEVELQFKNFKNNKPQKIKEKKLSSNLTSNLLYDCRLIWTFYQFHKYAEANDYRGILLCNHWLMRLRFWHIIRSVSVQEQ